MKKNTAPRPEIDKILLGEMNRIYKEEFKLDT